jgi:hypothetical protein
LQQSLKCEKVAHAGIGDQQISDREGSILKKLEETLPLKA